MFTPELLTSLETFIQKIFICDDHTTEEDPESQVIKTNFIEWLFNSTKLDLNDYDGLLTIIIYNGDKKCCDITIPNEKPNGKYNNWRKFTKHILPKCFPYLTKLTSLSFITHDSMYYNFRIPPPALIELEVMDLSGIHHEFLRNIRKINIYYLGDEFSSDEQLKLAGVLNGLCENDTDDSSDDSSDTSDNDNDNYYVINNNDSEGSDYSDESDSDEDN